MSIENYSWYLKAMQLTISSLIAIGIFIRWDVAARARKPLAFMFLFMAICYFVDLLLSLNHDIHPLMLQQGKGLGYNFGSMYNGILIITSSYIYSRALFKPKKLTIKMLINYNILLVGSLLVYAILSFMGYHPIPGYGFTELIDNLWHDPFALLWLVTMICLEIYIIYVSIISFHWLMIHKRNIKNNFSMIGGSRYYYIYITSALFYLTIPLGVITLWFPSNHYIQLISGVLFTIIITLIYVFSYLQEDIYTEEHPIENLESYDATEKQTIKIGDRILLEKLDKLITEDKIHTDSKLTAEILADRMMISRKKLYLLLKDYKNISFSDYINGNRIDYAEKLITNEKYISISILEISEMAGFNSIGTFNKFFKAKYNSTPAKYRDANMLHS